MKLVFKSYGGAQELLQMAGVLEPLVLALEELPTPTWAQKSATKGLSIVPPVLNALMSDHFLNQGWKPRPRVSPTSYRECDFGIIAQGLRILCEVQLGNTARSDSDIVKYFTASRAGCCDIALEIVPTRSTAKRMNLNTANFELFVDTVNGLEKDFEERNLPILVIGVEIEDDDVLELSQYFGSLPYKAVRYSEKIRLARELMNFSDREDYDLFQEENDDCEGTVTSEPS